MPQVRRWLRTAPVLASSLVLAGSLPTLAPVSAAAATCTWDGVQPPGVGSAGNSLLAVALTSRCNGWAAGDYWNGAKNQTLIDHWNGTSWSVQTSPNAGSQGNELFAVAAVSASDAWAVGLYASTVEQTLILHWNGSSWQIQSSPNAGTSYNELFAVAAPSASSAWAVGHYWNGTA
ncbi:MAG TPA: hypothetical protein VMV17_01545, partial [Streptosporangiaceae bacterium]|nr:hypothetical protein [Streptosporangiaceae bacterium]